MVDSAVAAAGSNPLFPFLRWVLSSTPLRPSPLSCISDHLAIYLYMLPFCMGSKQLLANRPTYKKVRYEDNL